MTDKSSNIQSKEKPKICAINLDSDIVEALQAKGLNCFAGTLGFPVKVPNLNRGDRHPCLPCNIFPPNLHEYDIIIVDLQHQEPIEYIESEHTQNIGKEVSKMSYSVAILKHSLIHDRYHQVF